MGENKNKENLEKKKLNEKYGEFVCTEFEWLSPERQKQNAERLSKITKKKK